MDEVESPDLLATRPRSTDIQIRGGGDGKAPLLKETLDIMETPVELDRKADSDSETDEFFDDSGDEIFDGNSGVLAPDFDISDLPEFGRDSQFLFRIIEFYHPNRPNSTVGVQSIIDILHECPRNLDDRISNAQQVCTQLKDLIIVQGQRVAIMESELFKLENKIHSIVQKTKNYKGSITSSLKDDIDEVESSRKIIEEHNSFPIDLQLSNGLQVYGNLFYLLQNEPKYLSRIFPILSQQELDNFVSSIMFSIFGNPYDFSEELLLLKIIIHVMELEFNSCSDITTFMRENSGTAKLFSIYVKRAPCQKALTQILAEPQRKVLENRELNLDINPRKIRETLYADGSIDQSSLDQDSINSIIEDIVKQRSKALVENVDLFLDNILDSDVPWGIRCICQHLFELSSKRFPNDPSITFGLIGGLVFLRFFSPAILDTKTSSDSPEIPAEARKNLISIVKVIQNVSNNSSSGMKEDFMGSISMYIHEKTKNVNLYFQKVSRIDPLKNFLLIDTIISQFARSDPIIYISGKDLFGITEIITKYVEAIAPEANDILKEIIKLIKKTRIASRWLHLSDKYFKLRLFSWMNEIELATKNPMDEETGPFRQSAQVQTFESLLKHVFIRHSTLSRNRKKILFNFDETNGADDEVLCYLNQLDEFISKQHFDFNTMDFLETIDKLKRCILAFSSDSRNLIVAQTLRSIQQEVVSKLIAQRKLETDVILLKEAIEEIETKRAALAPNFETLKEYLRNIFDQSKGKVSLSSWADEPVDSGPSYLHVIGKRNAISELMRSISSNGLDSFAMSSSILLDKLLDDLQRDVSDALLRKYSELSASKLKDDSVTETWSQFPRDTDFYQGSVEIIARLGKVSLNEVISNILEGIPKFHDESSGSVERITEVDTYALASTRAFCTHAVKKFSFVSFLQNLVSLDITDPYILDLTESTVNVVVVDIVFSILQYFDGAVYDLSEEIAERLIEKAFAFLLPRSPRKMKKSLWSMFHKRVSDVSSSILGLLCPKFVTKIAEKFFLLSKRDDENLMLLYLGLKFIRFDLLRTDHRTLFSKFLRKGHLFIQSKSALLDLKVAILVSFEHIFRLHSFSFSSSDFKIRDEKTLTDYFNTDIRNFFDTMLGTLWQKEDLRTPVTLLGNTILWHSPNDFFDAQVSNYLSKYVLKSILKESKKRLERLETIVHFCRGGGSTIEADYLQFIKGIPVDDIAFRFGVLGRKLSVKNLEVIFKTIFQRQQLSRHSQVLESYQRIVVSISINNFNFAIREWLPRILNPSTSPQIEFILIGLRALKIMVSDKHGFKNAVLRAHPELSEKEVTSLLEKLASICAPSILEIVSICENEVGLSSLGLSQIVRSCSKKDESINLEENAPYKTSSYRFFDRSDHEVGSTTVPIWDTQSLKNNHLFLDIYSEVIQLFPKIFPEKLVDYSKDNCGLKGHFVGRLIHHSEWKISQFTFDSMKRLMRKSDEERLILIRGLIQLLTHLDYQSVTQLRTTLNCLSRMADLWDYFNQETAKSISNDEFNSLSNSSRFAFRNANRNENAPTPWIDLRFQLDAVCLIYLLHPDNHVRKEAMDLTRSFQNLNNNWDRGRSTETYQNARSDRMVFCLGDLIDRSFDEILRTAVHRYSIEEHEESDEGRKHWKSASGIARTLTRSHSTQIKRKDFSSSLNDVFAQLLSFDRILSNLEILMPYCISSIVYICHSDKDCEPILYEIQRILSEHLKSLPPFNSAFSISEMESSKDLSEDFMRKWANYNGLFFACSTRLPGNRSPILHFPSDNKKEFMISFDSHKTPFSMLRSFLSIFVESFTVESDWLRMKIVRACMQLPWKAIPIFVITILEFYEGLEKRLGKKYLVTLTLLLKSLALRTDFVEALCIQEEGSQMLLSYAEFIRKTSLQLLAPKQLKKSKWANTRLHLMQLLGNLCRALCIVAAKGLKYPETVSFDVQSVFTIEERFSYLKWVMSFAKEGISPFDSSLYFGSNLVERASTGLATVGSRTIDEDKVSDSTIEDKKDVQFASYDAAQHLLSLGKCFPNQDLIATVEKEGLFEWFIQGEREGYNLLSSALLFHMSSLLPWYIDKIYKEPLESDFYFRALSDVIKRRDLNQSSKNLLNINENNDLTKIVKTSVFRVPINIEQSILKNHFGRLLLLTLIQTMSSVPQTRHAAFWTCVNLADFFMSKAQVSKYMKLKYAFESDTITWACRAALKISRWYSEDLPEYTAVLFREACYRIRASQNTRFKEWTIDLLKPWTQQMILFPLSSKSIIQSIPRSQKHQTAHISLDFLFSLFEITENIETEIQTKLLDIWKELAVAYFPTNLQILVEYCIVTATGKGGNLSPSFSSSKNILFGLFEVDSNRPYIIDVMMKYIFRSIPLSRNRWLPSYINDEIRSQSLDLILADHDIECESFSTMKNIHNFLMTKSDLSSFPGVKNCSSAEETGDLSDNLVSTGTLRARSSSDGKADESFENSENTTFSAYITCVFLVDLLGEDPEIIIPYVPLLSLYAILHLNHQNHYLHSASHSLLARISSLFGELSFSENAVYSSNMLRLGFPALNEILACENLTLKWPNHLSFFNNQVSNVYVSPDRKNIIVDAFVFCSIFGNNIRKKNSNLFEVFGFESFLWALQSTDIKITSKALTVYRGLLCPINHRVIHAILVFLLNSLEDWERTRWFMQDSGNYGKDESIHQRKVIMSLHTIENIMEKLVVEESLASFPALFWTGIALLRSDEINVYRKGLSFMSYLEKFDYIFKINGRNRVSVYQTAMSRLSTEEKILEESIKVFPEDFWVYSENWNPKFSGIQPYLVEGLYIPETEYVCLSLLLQLSRISWDRLVNSSSARNLTSLLSFLPWIIKLMHEKKEHYKGIRLQDIFELLSNIYERKNEYMHVLMKDAANDSEFTHERIQLFLEMVCQHIADVYFPIYIDECLDHIALILRSPMSHYHSTALQMCLHFLKHSCATIVLSRMRELIHIVYEILNRKDGDSDIKLLAADVITCVINLANSSISGYPQTMNRARVAEVGVRKFVSLGSSRNLKHVISALQQISRSCAVANRETSDVL